MFFSHGMRERGHHKLHAIFGRGHHSSGTRHGRGEGGGRRRLFDKDELRLILLKLIEEQPRHGYDLIREIEDRSGGAYVPSPGVIYPTLTLLSDMDLIGEAPVEGTRKQFEITHAGTVHLTDRTMQVEAAMAKLAEMSARRERTDGAPVRRAMGNLREVLQTRLSRDDVTIETLHDVAALLDEAAQKVERL